MRYLSRVVLLAPEECTYKIFIDPTKFTSKILCWFTFLPPRKTIPAFHTSHNGIKLLLICVIFVYSALHCLNLSLISNEMLNFLCVHWPFEFPWYSGHFLSLFCRKILSIKAGLAFSSLFSLGCLWPLCMFIRGLVLNWMLNNLSLWYYPSVCDECFPASSFITVLVFYCQITNYDKFSDLKQHKYTVSWLLWGLEPGCWMVASPLRVCHQAEI